MTFYTFKSLLEVLIVLVPTLLSVAYVTVAERKTMASMQRRLGPNIVGYYGLLQSFADALKLLLKEYVAPTQSNIILFFLGPVITLIFSLLGYAVIPYGPGLTVNDLQHNMTSKTFEAKMAVGSWYRTPILPGVAEIASVLHEAM
jgi:NADH-ubiquinone oxidoreductase chain 1